MQARVLSIILLLAGACAAENGAAGVERSDAAEPSLVDALAAGAAAYRGRRSLVVLSPSPASIQNAGQGGESAARLFFAPARDGSVTLHLADTDRAPFRLRIEASGRREPDGGWSGDDQGIRLRIDPRGAVSGGGRKGEFDFDVSGRISPRRAVLRVQVDATAAAPKAVAGMRHVHQYALDRDTPGAEKQAAARRGSDRKCRKIRWKLKPVMNHADGTLDSVRVPVCED